jgi:putative Mg2+ transporter-C (MgtC) family protein
LDWTLGIDANFWMRTAVALACGGAIGLERQLRGKPAGMRTCMLICTGTMFFVHLGSELGRTTGSTGDAARVVGQVVTGIGFLGAGVILTRDGLVKGMTSAAVVWMLAAIGSMIGLDKPGAALAATGVTLGILLGVSRLEHAYRQLRRGVHADSQTEAEGDDEPFSGEPLSGLPPPVRPKRD